MAPGKTSNKRGGNKKSDRAASKRPASGGRKSPEENQIQPAQHGAADMQKALNDDRIPEKNRQKIAKDLGQIGGNQSLTNIVARQAAQDRERPRLPEIDPTQHSGADPVAKSSPAVQAEWETLDSRLRELRLNLYLAQANGRWDPTRAAWYQESNALNTDLDTMQSEDVIQQTRQAYDALVNRIYDVSIPTGGEWEIVKDTIATELTNLLSGQETANYYAFGYLEKAYQRTRARLSRIDESVRVPADYADVNEILSSGEHLWKGELFAARDRFRELRETLRTVGELRKAGENPDEILPGWHESIILERDKLRELEANAPDSSDQHTYAYLSQELQKETEAALEKKKQEKGFLDRANSFSKGIITGIADLFIETGKQAIDTLKILTYVGYRAAGGEEWEPELYSDLAETVDKTGMNTWELVVAMGEGVIETPERAWKAIKDDDWEAVGREALNLYMLGKDLRTKVAGAKHIPGKVLRASNKAAAVLKLIKARAAVAMARDGMSEAAIARVRAIAQKYSLDIDFRPVDRAVIRLRERGHPGKRVELKMKTINKLDTYLGVSKDDIGKVGYFDPTLPENLSSFRPAKAQKIIARYRQRKKEWQNDSLKETFKDLADRGEVKLKRKVVYDTKTGKAFTGDYDLFDIRKVSKGKGLERTDLRYEDLQAEIRLALDQDPIATQHGEHLSWPLRPEDVPMFVKIIRDHRPGGKSLIRFTYDGKVERVHFND